MKNPTAAFCFALLCATGLAASIEYGASHAGASFGAFLGTVGLIFLWTFGLISSLSVVDDMETES